MTNALRTRESDSALSTFNCLFGTFNFSMATNPLAADDSGKHDLEKIEIRLWTEGGYRHYGFDVRDYWRASLRRRGWKRIYGEGRTTSSGSTDKVLHDAQCMERLLLDLAVNTTAM